MPNDTKRAGFRVQVEPALNAGGLAVSARNTAIPTPRNSYAPELSQSDILITRAITGLANLAASEAHQMAVRKQEADYSEGVAARVSANEELLADPSALFKDKSVDFIRGYNYQHGKAQGYGRASEMQSRFKANPDAYPTMGVLSGEMSALLQEDIRGMDEDQRQGYLEAMSQAEPNLRAAIAEHNAVLGQQGVADDWTNATLPELQIAAANGASVQDLHTIKTAAMERASITGMPRELANKQLIEMVTNIAIDTGRVDLFEIFDMDSPDVDNPDKTVPGLAKSSKWFDVIHDAKFKVASALASKRGESDEMAKVNTAKTIDALNKQGRFAEARALNDKAVESGIWKFGTHSSQSTAIDKAEKEYHTEQMFNRFVDTGTPEFIDSMDGMSKEQKTELYQKRYIAKMGEVADADPAKQAEVFDRLINEMSQQGVVIPALKGMLNATPMNPVAFNKGFLMWQSLYEKDPAYAHKYVSGEQLDQFRMYQIMLQSGESPEAALAAVQANGTPEAMDRARRQIGWDHRELLEYVDENVIQDAKTSGFNMDAGNSYYVSDWVDRRAQAIVMASGGHIGKEQAFKLASEDFKHTHSIVEVPGRDEVIWVRNSEGALNENDKNALADLSENLQKRYPSGPNASEKGYFAAPDEFGRWTVYKADSYMPVIENGRPVRFNSLKALTNRYQAGKAEQSAKDAQAANAEMQERTAEKRKLDSMSRSERQAYLAEKRKAEKQKVIDEEFALRKQKDDEQAKVTRKLLEKQAEEQATPKPKPEKKRKRPTSRGAR